MDQIALVEKQIIDGQRLVAQLVREGFPVTAACWVNASEASQWHLYLASPVVDDEGSIKAYRRIHAVIRQMPQPFWVGPFDVKVIGATSPVAQAVQDVHRQYPGKVPTRYRGARLGDLSIEEAHIYPPVEVPDQKGTPDTIRA
jgi:hypothetical protein